MTVILLRHGRSTANTARTLAGRTESVALDEHGRIQATNIAARLAELPIVSVIRSPLLRCRETLEPLCASLGIDSQVEERLIEVDYGRWTGRPLAELAQEDLWPVIQQQPSAVRFPGGECLADVAVRAVSAIRQHDSRLAREHGCDVLWIACSHGDVIKSIVADACGVHLDAFQRIIVEPASISVIRYTSTRPFLVRLNDTGADLSGLAGPPPGHLRDGKVVDDHHPERSAVATEQSTSYDAMLGGHVS